MKKLMALLLVLVLGLSMSATAFAEEAAVEEEVKLTADQQTVLDLVNAEREAAGLKPLVVTAAAQRAAKVRASELTEDYSHYRPDGTVCFTALYAEGVSENTYVAENIGRGYPTAEEVVEGWMNSKDHKANILNEKYTTIGIGKAVSGGKNHWVQLFHA